MSCIAYLAPCIAPLVSLSKGTEAGRGRDRYTCVCVSPNKVSHGEWYQRKGRGNHRDYLNVSAWYVGG